MEPRAKAILESSVRDFIEEGRPITSECLYEKHDFGIKPAMIRWELNDLCGAGYFYQNHPSGGRFPTDKAYRFFVKELLHNDEGETRGGRNESNLNKFAGLVEGFLEGKRDRLIHELADYLGVLSVGYEPVAEWIARSGFKDLCETLELKSRDDFVEVVSDFEALPDRLVESVRQWKKDTVWPQVFVGQSPITKSRYLSVIAHRLDIDDNDVFIIAIGPKRMDYEKSLDLLKSLERTVSHI